MPYSYVRQTVLDPFLGSGTTMKVAQDLNRNSIGIELDEGYLKMAQARLPEVPRAICLSEDGLLSDFIKPPNMIRTL